MVALITDDPENFCPGLNSGEEVIFEQDDGKKGSWSSRKHEGGYIQGGIDNVDLSCPPISLDIPSGSAEFDLETLHRS
jgi:hypothetical protein